MIEQIKELQALTGSEDEFVSRTAALALEIADAEAMGNITKEQAKEMLEDLVRADAIEGKSFDVQMTGMLITGVMGLASVM